MDAIKRPNQAKQLQNSDITPKVVEQFKKDAIAGMVKVLTSKEGYEVMKELSKR